MRRPLAVLISDTHYSLSTLSLAEAAYRMAIDKASELKVPLIDCGDLTNDKALLRAEVVNALISTMHYAKLRSVEVTLLVGNHSLINEKGKEHALNFLAPYATVIDCPMQYLGFHFIPYQATVEDFTQAVKDVSSGATLIMHQGVCGSDKGEYVHDHSAVDKDLLSEFRTISGHYHRAQDIRCGRLSKGAVGLMSYVGTPYTITYAEANDGPKGFQVLFDDGLLEQVPTNLRKHVIIERTVADIAAASLVATNPQDLVWVKLTGPRLDLEKLTRAQVAAAFSLNPGFKLDTIPSDSGTLPEHKGELPTHSEILDQLVDASTESEESKGLLKALWRKVMS